MTSPSEVARRTGLNLLEDLIYPGICLDSMPLATPVILDKDEESLLIARAVEMLSVADRIRSRLGTRWYRPYFVMDQSQRDESLPRSLGAVLSQEAGQRATLSVSADLPLALYKELSAILSLREMPVTPPPVFRYRASLSEATRRFAYLDWNGLVDTALALLANDGRVEQIEPYLEPHLPDRYVDLGRRMSEQGIEAILLANPLDIQELTGLGFFAVPHGSLVLFDGETVDLLSTAPLDLPGATLLSQGGSLDGFLKRHVGGDRIGVDDSLSLNAARAVAGQPEELVSVIDILRRWKEDRALEDLPAYIVAGRLTSDSQEAAFEHARWCREKGKSFSPRDLYNRALAFQDEYGKKQLSRLGLRVLPYFVNLHSAYQSIYPSVPSFSSVDPRCNCVRFDTGLLLADHRGIIKACSDVGRSLVHGGPGRALYDHMRAAIAEKVISSLTPGRRINEIHAQLVAEVSTREDWIKDCGLMDPEDCILKRYRRDVGHLLGKQEVTSLHFVPEETGALEDGFIGDIEMPWLSCDIALGYEDMFLVTRNGGVNISAK